MRLFSGFPGGWWSLIAGPGPGLTVVTILRLIASAHDGSLNKLGFSASKKEREEKLKPDKHILIEFGRDRVQLYVSTFSIPQASALLVDFAALPALERHVKLPDVAKFMFDDYLAWNKDVEQTAETSSWGRIILLAHTIKVKAGDTRDAGMRQVLSRLFKRSGFLVSHLEVTAQELAHMGLKWEHVDAYASPGPYEADFYFAERVTKATDAGVGPEEEDELVDASGSPSWRTPVAPQCLVDATEDQPNLSAFHGDSGEEGGKEDGSVDRAMQVTQGPEPSAQNETKSVDSTLADERTSQSSTAETKAPPIDDVDATTTVEEKIEVASAKPETPVDASPAYHGSKEASCRLWYF
ncbi:hypothetical protein BU23DRAFT_570758 [Bimuria novae-zelandiae CBS 107.79]|uniref:Uncharacterized protein n=1 Tax=Bimuria novae-zelandiae CBS 107.79 TaxID=1447943 RepID=A0A6A5V2U8_9PLEO|nr:hypothetical protein BU23DRAFT_570758 [Bimuria novae-zelandiae CBS 107.79]